MRPTLDTNCLIDLQEYLRRSPGKPHIYRSSPALRTDTTSTCFCAR